MLTGLIKWLWSDIKCVDRLAFWCNSYSMYTYRVCSPKMKERKAWSIWCYCSASLPPHHHFRFSLVKDHHLMSWARVETEPQVSQLQEKKKKLSKKEWKNIWIILIRLTKFRCRVSPIIFNNLLEIVLSSLPHIWRITKLNTMMFFCLFYVSNCFKMKNLKSKLWRKYKVSFHTVNVILTLLWQHVNTEEVCRKQGKPEISFFRI